LTNFNQFSTIFHYFCPVLSNFLPFLTRDEGFEPLCDHGWPS
jgi:hypothetical protein